MAWMAATWGSAGCVEGGGCLPESLGVTQMERCQIETETNIDRLKCQK